MDTLDTTNIDALPYCTQHLPGIGGEIKRYNEDFVVEEIPRYPASGEGTHTYLLIEKSGITTHAVLDMLGKALGRPSREFGYAGLKDAHGITRQWVSIEHVTPERIAKLAYQGLRIVESTAHTNKLKLGHLAGNQFIIRIRQHGEDMPFRARDEEYLRRAEAILQVLQRGGMPNFFGPQRFGVRGDNALVGLAMLRGQWEEAVAQILGKPQPFEKGDIRTARKLFDDGNYAEAGRHWPWTMRDHAKMCDTLAKGGSAERAMRALSPRIRSLYLNALQSELFNRVVALRMDSLGVVQAGDFAWKHANGACFIVEDGAVEQPRADAFEISPTGPIYGPRMSLCSGEQGALEERVLREAGLTLEQFRKPHGYTLDGARRPLRVPLYDCGVQAGSDERGSYIEVRFSLPSGSYATCVTRELCRQPQ